MTIHCVSVVMVGTFPPPTHGMAAVNAVVRQRLVNAGAEVLVLDVAAPSLDRGILQRLGRLPKVLWGLVRLIVLRGVKGRPLYMSVSGGLGQVYELCFLVVARIKRMRIILHHHSYAYLLHSSRLTGMLVRLAGGDALHVVLSQGMGERLIALYPAVSEVLTLSNAALLLDRSSDESDIPARNILRAIGFLSNLSEEKGVFEFLDVCAAAQEADLLLRAKLAGPFQDEDTERRVRLRLADLPNIEYVGPQYGEAKTRFYRGIDVFLFPTRYRNEAEPLVVLEAMREGVPVIAYGRGAIPEYVDETCGYVVPVDGDFVGEALTVLQKWRDQPETLQEVGNAARQRFQTMQARGAEGWKQLKSILLIGKEGASLDGQDLH